jgi:hypothetical protein
MNNVQKFNNCSNIPSSQTLRCYLHKKGFHKNDMTLNNNNNAKIAQYITINRAALFSPPSLSLLQARRATSPFSHIRDRARTE